MNTSPTLVALAPALSKAQGELQNAIKSSVNEFFSKPGKTSSYADLTSCLDVIRPTFSKHGLSFLQCPEVATRPDHIAVTTRLLHDSGEYIEATAEYPVTKKDAQGYVAANTYGRRCGIAAMSMLGLEDDDGNSTQPIKRGPGRPPSVPKVAPSDDAADGDTDESVGTTPAPAPAAAEKPKKQTKKADGVSPEAITALQVKFGAAKTKEDVTALVPDFTKLSPQQQTDMMPYAAEARKRAGL